MARFALTVGLFNAEQMSDAKLLGSVQNRFRVVDKQRARWIEIDIFVQLLPERLLFFWLAIIV